MDDRLSDYFPFYLPDDYRTDKVPRSNSSRFIRARVTSFWTKGQQAWDEDFNNTMTYWNAWMPMWTDWRRNYQPFKAAPWYAPFPKFVIDPKHYVPPTPLPDALKHMVYLSTPFIPLIYKPWSGAKAYVKADRMVVTFTGVEWKPAFRLPQLDKNFELAVYAYKITPGKVIFRYKVSQPFRLYAGNQDCRVRGWNTFFGTLQLKKNGAVCGGLAQSEHWSGISLSDDVDFLEGDILEMWAPEGPVGNWVSVSIIGGFLDR